MKEKLEQILSSFTAVKPPYSPEARLKSDLGINSLNISTCIIQVEEAFGVEFDICELAMANPMTVDSLSTILILEVSKNAG